MKSLLFILLTISSSVMYAQPGGGGRQGGFNQRGNRPSTNVERPAFNAQKASGIIKYDTDKILKRLKIQKNDSIAPKIKTAFFNYNAAMDQVSLNNKDLFEGIDALVKSTAQGAAQSKDRETFRKTMRLVAENLKPVREKVRDQTSILNNSLEELLSEKQYSKWLKYQKSEKDKLRPRTQRPQNGNNARPSGGRNRRG